MLEPASRHAVSAHLSDHRAFPKFVLDGSSIKEGAEIGRDLAVALEVGASIHPENLAAARSFIANSPVMGLRALLDSTTGGAPDRLEKIASLFAERRWVLDLFRQEIGAEPIPHPSRVRPVIVNAPALDDGGGDVATCFRIASSLASQLGDRFPVYLFVPPGAREWAERIAPMLSGHLGPVTAGTIQVGFSPFTFNRGGTGSSQLLAAIRDGVMIDYMSTSRLAPPGFNGPRWMMADADYHGDSACHSFLGFKPGAMGIPGATLSTIERRFTPNDRALLVQELSSRYGIPLALELRDTDRWSGTYLHLGNTMSWHLERLAEHAQESGNRIVNFDFSVTGMGEAASRVRPQPIPDHCAVIDLSNKDSISRSGCPVDTAKVLHLVLPRMAERDFISVLASADIAPMVRGVTTAFELMRQGGVFTTEYAYPNMEALWEGMTTRAHSLGASLPEFPSAYSDPEQFNRTFRVFSEKILRDPFFNADLRLGRVIRALLS